MTGFLVPFLALLALAMSYNFLAIVQDFLVHVCHLVKSYEISLLLWCGLLASLATRHHINTCRKKQVYLVDFACYKPDPACMCTKEMFMEVTKSTGQFRDESLEFQRRILERSGFSEKTYAPESLLKIPPNICLDEARKETESVIIGAIDELLLKTKVRAEDIGILVTNCCVFNPTPSLSAIVVNHYKLKHNIVSYNLSGMGCSAGLIAIDLGK